MQVEVVRSSKRHKTVSAREVGGILRVSIPATMTSADEEHWVEEMTRRTARLRAAAPVDLTARAAYLAERHRLPRPRSIRWSDNQQGRWGSCTPSDASIRISNRLAGEPRWVLDYVIVHELAHLDVAGHNQKFWAMVRRYPQTELARGFLIARSTPDPGGNDLPRRSV